MKTKTVACILKLRSLFRWRCVSLLFPHMLRHFPHPVSGQPGGEKVAQRTRPAATQGEFLKDVPDGVVVAEIYKGLGHPQECENGVDNGERHGAGASSSAPE